ncbi:hypothetical protein [Corynebacterium sp. HMSC074A01]|uniref:hypothetical protein n=1 Tax=Corynebacterium sp. HMSC074A01 TaxID=1715030 RepID=UPI0008A54FC6|nr:hypothetical protein [Corynebacterium sp. HMSC074A01]OHF36716.1 hypothetical protein HMPREF2550_05630 [Corynebacterium sp. HMSC074A01]
MSKKITSFSLALVTAAFALVGCGDSSSDTIPGTSPAIAAAVCDGDAGCESDMRTLSHKLDSSDDADGNGLIDQEELNTALDRLDREEKEAEEAAASSAAAASSSAAAERSSEAAAKKREAEASSRRAKEREAADREQAEREAAQREQAAREQAAAEQAAAEQAAAEQAAAEQAAAEQQQQQQQAGPQMEYATMGPYGSLFTCEQARDSWPVQSSPCYTGSDGNAYFEGMRQAMR